MSEKHQLVKRTQDRLSLLPAEFHTLSGAKKHDAVISLPDPQEFVQSLAPEELFLLIQDIGPTDCMDLIVLATNNQRQSFVDLDCWVGDELDIESLDRWLDLIAEGSPEAIIDTVGHLDPEILVVYFLQSIVEILDRTQEDEILNWENQAIVISTPDLDYRLVLRVEDLETVPRIQRMITQLYRFDPNHARKIINSCRTGLKIESEEQARRFRVGRLSDMGFPDPEDAHILYASIPVEAVKKTLESQPIPSILGENNPIEWALSRADKTGLFFNACMANANDVERLIRDFALCVNRAIVASPEGLMLRDLSRLEEVGRIVHATISLGLEYLADGNLDRGTEILDKAWLVQLFQCGHRLTVERAIRGRKLMARGGGLLSDDVLASVTSLQVLPQPRFIDQNGQSTPFTSLADLETCDALLARGENLCRLFEQSFGFSIERFKSHIFGGLCLMDKRFVRFTTLARTMLAHTLLGNEPSFEPIELAQFDTLLAQLDQLPSAVDDLVATFGDSVRELLEQSSQNLMEELGALQAGEKIKPGMLMGVLLLKENQVVDNA